MRARKDPAALPSERVGEEGAAHARSSGFNRAALASRVK